MCDCLTLGICCKKTCSIKNLACKITLWVFGGILIAALIYGILIGYGCLWAQFIWPRFIRGLGPTNCVDADPIWIYFIFIFGGAFEFLITFMAIALIGIFFYGIYKLFEVCIKCCRKKYVEAKLEVENMQTDKEVQLEVKIESN